MWHGCTLKSRHLPDKHDIYDKGELLTGNKAQQPRNVERAHRGSNQLITNWTVIMLPCCSLLEKQSDVERWNLLLLWRNDTFPNKQPHYETAGLVGSDHEESQLCWSRKSCNFVVPAGNRHSNRTPTEAVCQFLFSRSRMGIIIQASKPDQDKRFPSFSHFPGKFHLTRIK